MLEKLLEIEELEVREAEADAREDEEESDRIYAEKYHKAEEVAEEIERMTDNKIDHKTAMRMVWHKREELKGIIKRAM